MEPILELEDKTIAILDSIKNEMTLTRGYRRIDVTRHFGNTQEEPFLIHAIIVFMKEQGYALVDENDRVMPTNKIIVLDSFAEEKKRAQARKISKEKSEETTRKLQRRQLWSIPVTVTVAIVAALFSIGSTAWNISQGNKIKPLEEKMKQRDSMQLKTLNLESRIQELENYNAQLEWRLKPLEDSINAQ